MKKLMILCLIVLMALPIVSASIFPLVDVITTTTSGKIEFENTNGDEIEIGLLKNESSVKLGDDGIFWFAEQAYKNGYDVTSNGDLLGSDPEIRFLVSTDGEGTEVHHFRINAIQNTHAANTILDIEDLTTSLEEELLIDTSGADTEVATTLFGDHNFVVEWDNGGDGDCTGSAGSDMICLTDKADGAITQGYLVAEENGDDILSPLERIGLEPGSFMALTQDNAQLDVAVLIVEDSSRLGYPANVVLELDVNIDDDVAVVEPDGTHNGGTKDGKPDVVYLGEPQTFLYRGHTNGGAIVDWNDDVYDAEVSLAKWDLSDFSRPFVKYPGTEAAVFDAQIVIGDEALPCETILASNLLPSIQTDMYYPCGDSMCVNPIPAGTTVVASAAGGLGSTNQIIIGHPCENTLALEFLRAYYENEYASCEETYFWGEGELLIMNYSDHTVMLITGENCPDDHCAARREIVELLANPQHSFEPDMTEYRTGRICNKVDCLPDGCLVATQEEYETKTYTLDGMDYEVEVVIVTATEARFNINGELTSVLQEGDSSETASGLTIKVNQILDIEGTETGGADLVAFTLCRHGVLQSTNYLVAIQEEYTEVEYVVNSVNYEVEVTLVTATDANFKIDGESIIGLTKGESYTTSSGLTITVDEVLDIEGTETGGGDLVTFTLCGPEPSVPEFSVAGIMGILALVAVVGVVLFRKR